ncbi:MAG: hypothetical protein A3J38_01180 [Gammaproteobacteria bacterium RIFCSPHIGHO2_12_FULL_45_9]|nr:MAG: hypothetical protein A3J38_01180 [Gammaproteobacteria bacterium RIFCSPHIGHO2_12_FULL_45_9]
MPRPLRIEYENAWYHVMNRGINHQTIFSSDSHRELFLSLLEDTTKQYNLEIHAYCLMTNHYHILVRTPLANLSRCMRHLDGVYTQRYNHSVKRDGPLFRGRYKAIIVEENSYLLLVSRYIHLNPVAAKICNEPHHYKWSSYLAYLNLESRPSWLQCGVILNQIHGRNSRESYLLFTSQGIDQEIKNFYGRKQLASILGSEIFIASHLNNLDKKYVCAVATDVNRTIILPTADRIFNCISEYFSMTKNEITESQQGKKNLAKLLVIYLLRRVSYLTHTEIASHFDKLQPASIAPVLSRCNKMAQTDETFIKHVNQLSLIVARQHSQC